MILICSSKIVSAGLQYTLSFKNPPKRSHRVSDPESMEAINGAVSSYDGWGTFGPDTETQEQKCAEGHHSVECGVFWVL